MEYISIAQAAEKWGVTPRRVQEMCKSGLIEGATHFGRAWAVPDTAQRPADGRTKQMREAVKNDGLPHMPMPRKNPLLIYTDLYSTPGTADRVVASLADQPEAARLMQSQLDYNRGNIDKIYDDAQYFINSHSGFNAVVGGGMQLAIGAMWRGDLAMWRRARQHIYEAPCGSEEERQALGFWLYATDSKMGDTREFPEWFKHGIFDCLPADSHGTARIFYVKYLFICAHQLAKGELQLRYVNGMGLMRTLPYIIEPMLCQAKVERTLLPQIYLHLMAATVYHNMGDNHNALPHIDRAIELCMPDGLYSPLIEYKTGLDGMLDERLALFDEVALKRFRDLHKQMNDGWIKLHNALLERNISSTLTVREREVARLAAFGFGNTEIANRLHIEVSSVKRYIFSAMNKVGALKRTELGQYV